MTPDPCDQHCRDLRRTGTLKWRCRKHKEDLLSATVSGNWLFADVETERVVPIRCDACSSQEAMQL